ncbi:MAG: hypothetical protein R3C10_02685 [Pirellulales bacterium]
MTSFFTPYSIDGGGSKFTLPISDAFTHEWTFTEAGTVRFQFEVYGDEEGGGPSHITLDATGFISPVPEPAALLSALLAAALVLTQRTPGSPTAAGVGCRHPMVRQLTRSRYTPCDRW